MQKALTKRPGLQGRLPPLEPRAGSVLDPQGQNGISASAGRQNASGLVSPLQQAVGGVQPIGQAAVESTGPVLRSADPPASVLKRGRPPGLTKDVLASRHRSEAQLKRWKTERENEEKMADFSFYSSVRQCLVTNKKMVAGRAENIAIATCSLILQDGLALTEAKTRASGLLGVDRMTVTKIMDDLSDAYAEYQAEKEAAAAAQATSEAAGEGSDHSDSDSDSDTGDARVTPELRTKLTATCSNFAKQIAADDDRGGRCPLVDSSHYGDIQERIQDLVDQDIHISSQEIADIIESVTTIRVSARTGYRILGRLGYHYGRLRKILVMDVERIARAERFLREYAKAKKEEDEGKAISVFIDETYVHTSHCRGFGWIYTPTTAAHGAIQVNGVQVAQEVARGGFTGDLIAKSKGQRLIILHAITKDGLLAQVDATGAYKDVRIEFGKTVWEQEYLTAEWAFQADARLKDYHDNMDHYMFMRWVEKQLTPTFVARYGAGMKMNLFMDNAPYHTAGPPDSLKPWSMGKAESITALKKLLEDTTLTEEARAEIGTIPTSRCVIGDTSGAKMTFNVVTQGHLRGGNYGPYTGEVTSHLEAVLRKHFPKKLMTSMEIYFAEKGWGLIYTPPYMPKFQPIERCWAYCKNGVAEEYTRDRKLAKTHSQLLDMWYGGKSEKKGEKGKGRMPIDGVRSQGWIKKCEEDMDSWIKKFGVKCSGTVKNLQWNSTKAYSDGKHYDNITAYAEDDVEGEGVQE